MPQACAQLRTAALERGWEFEALHESEMFVRLRLASSDTLLVDLATDVAPGRPPHLTVVGPTFDQEELAGRELLALFDRAKRAASSTSTRSPSVSVSRRWLNERGRSTSASTTACLS